MFFRKLLSPFLPKNSRPIYFIILNKQKEGPLSLNELKIHTGISPLTLVWRKGLKNWVPMGSLPELRSLFEQKDKKKFVEAPPVNGHEIVLEEGKFGFFPSIWWVILTVGLILYSLYRLWISR